MMLTSHIMNQALKSNELLKSMNIETSLFVSFVREVIEEYCMVFSEKYTSILYAKDLSSILLSTRPDPTDR